MEELIKKAIEGGWKPNYRNIRKENFYRTTPNGITLKGTSMDINIAESILDPLFFQALKNQTKVECSVCRKEYDDPHCFIDHSGLPMKVRNIYQRFHEINYDYGLDKAVDYLLDLIKK